MHNDIKKAVEIMRKGGVILYPTDTIWGLGCDATNPKAVERIFHIKQRAESKAMLVLMGSEAELERYVDNVPEVAYNLIEVADKPLTIIYDKAHGLAQNLLAEDGSVGIRIPKDMFCKQLCQQMRKPIVSTSANVSGSSSPCNFAEIDDAIKNAVDYVVEYSQGDTTSNNPSSVIKLSSNGVIKIIRQ